MPLYVHLSSDSFEPDLLLPAEGEPGLFVSTRMVPPGALDYYFSTEARVLHARNLPSKESGGGKRVTHRGPVESMEVPRMNYIENVLQTR